MNYNERQYLNLLDKIYKYGMDTGDRTGTGMRSLFGESMEFDLREGFPLLTTKKMFVRGIFGELLWFLSGSTSGKELREKYNIHFWKEWENENGELNNIYGKQWIRFESNRQPIKIKKKILHKDSLTYPLFEMKEYNEDEHEYIGKTIKSNKYGEYKIIKYNGYEYIHNRKRETFDVQFLYTGYVAKSVRKDNVLNGEVYDPYYPSVCGIGFMGEYVPKNEIDKHLAKIWEGMMNRCYNKNYKEYHLYGGKGVFVASRWWNRSNFINDVKYLPNWHKKKNNLKGYSLDKDYYGSNCYSKDTCVWLSNGENALYAKAKPFIIYNDSFQEIHISQTDCANKYGLKSNNFSKVFQGKSKTINGYKLKHIEVEDDCVYRYPLPFNQIEYVINEIKNNPTSRRILFTGWNAPEMQWKDTALPCCHSTVVQFYVEDGFLSMYHYQRSGDMFLGVPVNIASYATLLTMIAQQCNLKPGIMKHTIGVAHIYHNHLKQVEEQLSRTPYEPPKLIIKRKPDSIFDYQLEDFEVVDYKHHPLIKGEVAV